jgi:hypothetical protein
MVLPPGGSKKLENAVGEGMPCGLLLPGTLHQAAGLASTKAWSVPAATARNKGRWCIHRSASISSLVAGHVQIGPNRRRVAL